MVDKQSNEKVWFPILTNEDIDDCVDNGLPNSNIPSYLKITLHNQRILNEKLDKLLNNFGLE